jgi:hypothetical protein
MKPLLELPWRSCKWPVAEQSGQHLFCGVPLPAGTSEECFYCPEHFAKSRVPTSFTGLDNRMAAFFSRHDRVNKRYGQETTRDLTEELEE